ncbi:hypothetical protein HWV62_12442 [Athelia sp. TMB]|nr:hypothetical protein HWV62_12442 [Athelia sp. TMB]
MSGRAGTFVEGTYDLLLGPSLAIKKNKKQPASGIILKREAVSVKREFLSPPPPPSKKLRMSTGEEDFFLSEAPTSDDTCIPSSPVPQKGIDFIPAELHAYIRSSRRLRALSPIKITPPKELRYSSPVSSPSSPNLTAVDSTASRSPSPGFRYPILTLDDSFNHDSDPSNTEHFTTAAINDHEILTCGGHSGFICALCIPTDPALERQSQATSISIPIGLTPQYSAQALYSDRRMRTEAYLNAMESLHVLWDSNPPALADALFVGFEKWKGDAVFELRGEVEVKEERGDEEVLY